ncbi:hypothetical protein OM416_20140 [Paenibacillus sp. LS1]|uniref:hypothetical protein n=1 Tax=Paenibacillus sp. LS1 TaxID=2992120 RepID=UPI00222E2BAC|nr:hypothetical protein [Paenibacillus sp. LS1]MCW3793907.1 hypothetical protein [Paenibacillus sp. LS1]
MESFTFKTCEKDLEQHCSLLLPAIPDHVDVQLEEYKDFLKLVALWKTSVIFYDIQRLEEFEIEDQLINDNDLNRRPLGYVKEEVSNKVREFNESQNRLRVHIGEEQEITLFLAHEGMMYCFEHSNDERYPKDKEQFIEGLLEQYEDEIEALKEKESSEHLKLFRQRIEHLRNFLIEEKDFHMCTNVGARKAFVRNLDIDPKSPIDLSGIPSGIWLKTVEEAWEQVKLLKVRTKT